MASRQICVITTGGTIDSFATGDSLSVEDAASGTLTGLLDEVTRGRAGCEIASPLNKNSEDFSLHDIEAIAAAIDRKARQGHTLFLVTHGTDSLHATAAALGLLFSGADITICLVAAFRPLNDEGSDGPANLRAAVAWLLSGEAVPSTYVALKRDVDLEPVLICDWREVKPLDFDSRGMESLGGREAASWTMAGGLSIDPHETRRLPLPDLDHAGLGGQSRHVRLIHAYPGLNSEVLEALARKAEVIVIGAYHSGTLPSEDDAEQGVTAFMRAHPGKLVLLARHPDRLKGYASVKRFEAAGGMVIRHLLPHQAHMLACLLRAGGKDTDAMRRVLLPFSQPSREGEDGQCRSRAFARHFLPP